MPVLVKLDVVIRQGGVCKQTGDRLGTLKNTRFDHRPAIWERQFDTEKNDTIPPANDANFIEALTVRGHDIRTFGPGGEKRITTLNSDAGRRSKAKRIANRESEHAEAILMKAERREDRKTSKWPKGRKIQSKGFERRKDK
jgi:hypothetical protein